MNRRIRKKKGLIRDQRYSEIKKEMFQAMEINAAILEQKAEVQSTADSK